MVSGSKRQSLWYGYIFIYLKWAEKYSLNSNFLFWIYLYKKLIYCMKNCDSGIKDYFYDFISEHSNFKWFSKICCWQSIYSLCNAITTNRTLKTSSHYSDGCVKFQKETHADLFVTNLRIVDPLNFLTARDLFTCSSREDPLTCVKHGLRLQEVSVNPLNTMRCCEI